MHEKMKDFIKNLDISKLAEEFKNIKNIEGLYDHINGVMGGYSEDLRIVAEAVQSEKTFLSEMCISNDIEFSSKDLNKYAKLIVIKKFKQGIEQLEKELKNK